MFFKDRGTFSTPVSRSENRFLRCVIVFIAIIFYDDSIKIHKDLGAEYRDIICTTPSSVFGELYLSAIYSDKYQSWASKTKSLGRYHEYSQDSTDKKKQQLRKAILRSLIRQSHIP